MALLAFLLLALALPTTHAGCPPLQGLSCDANYNATGGDGAGAFGQCGDHAVRCSGSERWQIQFFGEGAWCPIKEFSHEDRVLVVQDPAVNYLQSHSDCGFVYIFPQPARPLPRPILFAFSGLNVFNCDVGTYDFSRDFFTGAYKSSGCAGYELYYAFEYQGQQTKDISRCAGGDKFFEWRLQLDESGRNLFLLSAGFSRQRKLHPHCFTCQMPRGEVCTPMAVAWSNSTACSCGGTCSGTNKRNRKIAIGVGAGVGGFLLASALCLLLYRRKKMRARTGSSTLLFRTAPSEPSSQRDPEMGSSSTHYSTNLFEYDELSEATNGFSDANELGDGGFGTVYKGKLRDGRIVAVKRLYENNYKRVDQFKNEVGILNRLRHQNLVTLYGCTSRHSRELLLVYEYVPNGTVADHLHGHRASEGELTWPIRLNIAMETATALAYLHKVEPQIIHRDVKTNNILLDNGFHVKVADFGLSRLFPVDATHVSTAPQGTPGYVDPEYHQCYQLTDKSDVYSFGVVLVELISSKPAVDITRHRHEINLANMAINKIQNGALHELVDPALEFETDWVARRMIKLVAELAFRCLQAEKEMRPSMEDVVEVLQGIHDCQDEAERSGDMDHGAPDDTSLLKNNAPVSPDSVMDKWASRTTTPNTSA